MGKEKARGKPWRWIVAGAGAMLAAIACLLAFRRDPYAFLNRFHPRKVDVDFARALGAPPPGSKARPVVSSPKIKMLVFRTEDAGLVLKAMEEEFTPSRGLSKRHMFHDDSDDNWEFFRGSPPSPSSASLPDGSALYSCGEAAASEEWMFEHGTTLGTVGKGGEKTACIVFLFHDANWLDRSLDAIRAFLHVD
ncbi:MAG TPA: hypothetical protein VHE55_15690 [Fimbriimonadaceae bacterium]|nr:hypothetical protein [Fimbriimonadaceae bacterium]